MKKKFTVECEMEERWVPYFLSMLNAMESYGIAGTSREVGIYSDGDGDFRPKFKPDIEYEKKLPVKNEHGNIIFDAG